MNRKLFLLTLVLFLAVVLAFVWLVRMPSPALNPGRPTPVPVPAAPAVDNLQTNPAANSSPRLQPQPRPVPTPESTPTPAMAAVRMPSGNVPALSTALILLAAAGLVLSAGRQHATGRREASGA